MITYNPDKPLISLHIPKCAGQSFRCLLNGWFGDNFFIHYFQQRNALPVKHPLKPGMCIHGHFDRRKKMGAGDYYPTVAQFITVLRDPLEMAISNYFFWKTKARQRQIALGMIKEGSEQDYKSIDDFFRQRPRSHLLNFLPADLTADNYGDILESRFIWVGLVENLQESLPVLADRLGFSQVPIDRINVSPRDEELSPDIREAYMHRNRFEFNIYRYLLEWWSVHPKPGVNP